MLSRLGNPLLMQEDDSQEQGHHEQQQQQQIVPLPPPIMGLGMMPPPGQEEQNLLAQAASATAGNMGFPTPGILDDDWYFDGMAASAGVQESLFLTSPAQAGRSMTGAGSQMFSLFNLGSSGVPFDLCRFNLGLSGGSHLASIASTASNSSSLSLIPSGNAGLLGSFGEFGTALASMPDFGGSLGGFDVFDNGASSSLAPPQPLTDPFTAACGKAAVVLRPLEISPPVGAQPTLFQKRALRCNAGEEEDDKKCKAGVFSGGGSGDTLLLDDGDDDWLSIDVSGLNYDSEDTKGVEDSDKKNTNANTTVTAGGGADDRKGKKKGMPAKNLMAERRRRKKLNDRLYMLRSVVPKITKMDKASILGDAVEYVKELTQKISDLQNELESPPSTASPLPPTPTSFHPLTPTVPSLPCRVKEEPDSDAMQGPTAQQPSIEVRIMEGRVVNIHMFCERRPDLLLSAMRAIEGLGLDVQQAVFSCFNGFSLDVFKAEVCRDGPGVMPDEIKAVLLNSAGF